MRQRTVAVVQARMGSQRFPGKMMAPLGTAPLLSWVLRRVSAAGEVDEVMLATSDNERDDPLAELAAQLGVSVFRGPEDDVLARFVGAATAANAEWAIRVCADNPFVDPGEIDRLVRFFSANPCDYACNHLDRMGSGYADGFGAEILSLSLLQRLAVLASDARHREHVTLYLWDHQNDFRLSAVPAPPELHHPRLRFDVDQPIDLESLAHHVANGVTVMSAAAHIVQAALASGGADGTNTRTDGM